MSIKLRDPVSGLTHLTAALLSIPALIVLVYYAVVVATAWQVVSFAIFGTSLILLYTASTLYHLLPLSEKGVKTLRRIDHMMIFVLIAGTYTPVCLVPLRGVWGWSLLASIWSLALIGVILKIVWFNAPRWLSTLLYVLMGWMVIIAIYPMVQTIPAQGLAWLVGGGLFYSIGAVIYAIKRPRLPIKWLGFHEIFHLFVMAGSFSHFWFMFRYILYL